MSATSLADSLGTVFIGLCGMSVRASVFLALFLAMFLLFGKLLTPRWRHMLWLVLILSLFLPWRLPLPLLTLGSDTAAMRSPEQVASTRRLDVGSPTEERADLATGIVASPAGSDQRAGTRVPNRFTFWAALVWLAGVSLLLLRLTVLSVWLTRRATRSSEAVPHQVREQFEKARLAITPRHWPSLIVTSQIDSPALLGAIRPKILLPVSLAHGASSDELWHLFLHELAHLKRGDIWSGWLWSMALALHWFNPLFWWVGRRIARDRELACDEHVLRSLSSRERWADYGRTLLRLSKLIHPMRRSAGWVGILENQHLLRRRIDMIAKYRASNYRSRVVGGLLFVSLVLCSIISVAERTQPLAAHDAELMGRVEHFFLHNFRDVSARKSLEWGTAESGEEGAQSIRYKYRATIWDKETKVMNQRFTFDKEGNFVEVQDLPGYPKPSEPPEARTHTEDEMKALVEHFFDQNYRDITARKSLQWGAPYTDEAGHRCIRYRFEATIRNKDVVVLDKLFVFTDAGKFVAVKDVPAEQDAAGTEAVERLKALSYASESAEDKENPGTTE